EPYERGVWNNSPINRIRGRVTALDRTAKQLKIEGLSSGTLLLNYDILVIATGSKPRFLDWPNAHLKGVSGLYHLTDLEKIESYTQSHKHCKNALVVGGGLIGVELAEMLHSRKIDVKMLIREPLFWSSVLPDSDALLVQKHLESRGVEVVANTEVKGFLTHDGKRVSGVELSDNSQLEAQFVGVSIGVQPHIYFLEESGLELGQGILVNEHLQTSDKSIFAIGDCAELRQSDPKRRALEAVWYVARQMADALSKHLIDGPFTYVQGHWFNSAKFFDLEYQTYGQVSNSAKRKNSEQHFHWHNTKMTKGLTLAYEAHSRLFLGVNAFGIRLKQSVFEHWLDQSASIDTVVEQLETAHFDTEFSKNYTKELKHAFVSNNS
ncbi:MAG: NAD(P)/FAD-dependent oxidoreductase, partial [Flavobacteriaceae bacterium]